MKVILLQDVAKIGRRFDVVDVPDGYALNKLMPKKMAEAATPENIKRVTARRAKLETDRIAEDAAFDEAVESLKDKTITLEVSANEIGHLFKAVTAAEIIAALADEHVSVTETQIVIATPIKEVGTHTVMLVSGQKRGECTLEVVAK